MNLARYTRGALLCLALAFAKTSLGGPEEMPQSNEPIVETPTSSGLSFKLSGEYVGEATYVGEAAVRRGHQLIDNFDESDTTLQFVFTPRVSLGVLRLGFQYER